MFLESNLRKNERSRDRHQSVITDETRRIKFLYHSIRMWIVRGGVLNPLSELVKDCVSIEKDNDKLQLSEIEAPDTKKRRLIQKTGKG